MDCPVCEKMPAQCTCHKPAVLLNDRDFVAKYKANLLEALKNLKDHREKETKEIFLDTDKVNNSYSIEKLDWNRAQIAMLDDIIKIISE